MYGYGFLSRGFTDRRKIFCTAVRPDLGQVFCHFEGIAPGMAELWASTGAIWWDMLLAEALVLLAGTGLFSVCLLCFWCSVLFCFFVSGCHCQRSF